MKPRLIRHSASLLLQKEQTILRTPLTHLAMEGNSVSENVKAKLRKKVIAQPVDVSNITTLPTGIGEPVPRYGIIEGRH